MKFVELKKSLQNNLSNCYLLEGEDRYVVNNALSLIEKKVNLVLPDVNKIVFDEDNANIEDIVFQLESMPFGDNYKLIVLKNTKPVGDIKALEKSLKHLADFIVFVVCSYASCPLTKMVKNYAEMVDCSKLDAKTIAVFIGGKLKQAGVGIEQSAMEKLITYTSSNMARIETELNKLASMGEPVITEKLVDKYVIKDKEYQIYELADYLSKREADKAYDLAQTLIMQEKNPVGFIQYLYTTFRKLLLVSLSVSESDETLADVFKCKPYAIKFLRTQAKKFTPKQLKNITNSLASLEYDIKNGKANVDNAVDIILAKILNE